MTQVALRIRRLLVDSPNSLGGRSRAKRWAFIQGRFPSLRDMHVLDLGGTVEAWRRAPVRPASVTILNLYEPGQSDDPRLQAVLGDACRARAALTASGARATYDLVLSNSLIEHVGGHAQRAAFAEEVHALAPHHWVQTPYRYFPIEPHWLFPGLQFLPIAGRAKIAARWPLAHSRPTSSQEAMSEVQWTELIGIAQMHAYFPNSWIFHEKIMGLTKSIIAVQ